jgi:hypothetical protein
MTGGLIVAGGVVGGVFLAGCLFGAACDVARWWRDRHRVDEFVPSVGSKWWLEDLFDLPAASDPVRRDDRW